MVNHMIVTPVKSTCPSYRDCGVFASPNAKIKNLSNNDRKGALPPDTLESKLYIFQVQKQTRQNSHRQGQKKNLFTGFTIIFLASSLREKSKIVKGPTGKHNTHTHTTTKWQLEAQKKKKPTALVAGPRVFSHFGVQGPRR